MSLKTLLEGWVKSVEGTDHDSLTVEGLSLDSRSVQAGDAFVAVQGALCHGSAFAKKAQAAGARVVLHDGKAELPALDIPTVEVPGLGDIISSLASRFYHAPSEHLTLAGVTGTNGKTTTSHFIAQGWERAHGRAGLIGTLGFGPLKQLAPGDRTTPDAITLQKMLSDCIDQGVERLAMEVSSHALAQGRCDDVQFDLAVFTNLSRDHLDYHGSMESYMAAKRRLFTDHNPRFAVINSDDPAGKSLINDARPGCQVLTYGTNGSSELRAGVVNMDTRGMTLEIKSPWGNGSIHTPLLGRFNVYNLMAAAGSLALLGMDFSMVLHQLELIHAVPGRMARLGGEYNQPVVVVDYAHTPDALEQALMALRAHLHGRLICVFGCGGDRDQGKRPMMARVVEKLADRLILTSDNPRTESPARIIDDMLAGMERPERADVIPDRAASIRAAISQSNAQDIILVAGKGHETWQEIDGQKIPFSDADTVCAALEEAA
jgi:UDP-N-acetylmuramoyl-L-alanyl-D-glutamate--2,6-diaminopimelate ligase